MRTGPVRIQTGAMATRDYPAAGIVVHWDSSLCIHSRRCFGSLPEVFRPRERPWIQVEHATEERIVATVENCPSGALSWSPRPADSTPAAAPAAEAEPAAPQAAPAAASVTVHENGPYEVNGPITILDADGQPVRTLSKVFLCRCGHSSKKPYCDSTHRKIGFTDPGRPAK